ncbi:MAG: minor capsid protein [Ruminococcus sp.]|nr:minor capsid protein [Ruminococcus sp.]
MYEFTDKVLAHLNRQYIVIFNRLKSKVSTKKFAKLDEVTVIGKAVDQTYTELMTVTKPMLLQIANWAYHNYCTNGSLTEMWLTGFLNDYSPVTKYAFSTEIDRKRSRLYEALIATKGSRKEIDNALRYWAKMIAEYAVEITDAATLEAFNDLGITKVEWFTEEDERVCGECGKRHGRIYPIDAVPPKPHWGCRCYLRPVTTE